MAKGHLQKKRKTTKGSKMKKLIMAAGVAICAASLQAATYNWSWDVSTPATAAYDSSSDVVGNTTAYLFFDYASSSAANSGKTALIEALFAGTDISGFKDSASLGADGISSSRGITATADSAPKYYGFVALLAEDSDGGKWVYVSANKNGTGLATGATALSFAANNTSVYAMDGDALNSNTSGTGWHQYAPANDVPEPTSGLLMLLGVAGLALRRRRA